MSPAARLTPLFGINIDPGASASHRALDLAVLADQSGLDVIGIQDHPYNGAFLDTWTLLAVLGARTRRVRLLTNVADLPLRPPAMLAKAAATLDIVTEGRVELGLGAGAFWDAIGSYGGPWRAPGEAVQALDEAITVLRLIWGQQGTGAPVSFAGQYYQLTEAQAGPAPAHAIGIWLGALGPRMLRLTGRRADGWSVSENYVPAAKISGMQQQIDEAAAQAGRDPSSIRRNYNLMGMIQRADQLHARPRQPGLRFAPISEWVDTLVRYQGELGMDSFIYWPVAGDEHAQLRLWAEEVVPAVRERTQARGGTANREVSGGI